MADVPQGVTVVRIARERRGVQHELATGGAGLGCDDGRLPRNMHSVSGAWKEYSFRPALALALLLGVDLAGAGERDFERSSDVLLATDLAADVAAQPARAGCARCAIANPEFPGYQRGCSVSLNFVGLPGAMQHQERMVTLF